MSEKKDEEKIEKEEVDRIEEEVHMEMETQKKKAVQMEKTARLRDKKMNMEANLSSRTPFPVALLLVVLALLCGLVLGPSITTLFSKETGLGGFSTASETRLTELEERVGQLEKQEQRMRTGSVTPSGITDSGLVPLTGVQETQSVLSKRLHDIESKLQASSEATATVQTKAETGLATVLAFMQMQRVALVGRPFEKERLVLVDLVGEDEAPRNILDKLEAFSIDGIASLSVLQKQWHALEGETQAAMRQAGAHTWQDRIIVAIENLISIRSLTPESGMSLTISGIALDLAQERVSAALRKASSLPAEVQPIIETWYIKAMARNKTEKLMDRVARSLIASDRAVKVGDTIEENEALQEPAL